MSRRLRKKQRSLGFSTMSDTNQTVELEKKARRLKFQIYVEEVIYYPCSLAKINFFMTWLIQIHFQGQHE